MQLTFFYQFSAKYTKLCQKHNNMGMFKKLKTLLLLIGNLHSSDV